MPPARRVSGMRSRWSGSFCGASCKSPRIPLHPAARLRCVSIRPARSGDVRGAARGDRDPGHAGGLRAICPKLPERIAAAAPGLYGHPDRRRRRAAAAPNRGASRGRGTDPGDRCAHEAPDPGRNDGWTFPSARDARHQEVQREKVGRDGHGWRIGGRGCWTADREPLPRHRGARGVVAARESQGHFRRRECGRDPRLANGRAASTSRPRGG